MDIPPSRKIHLPASLRDSRVTTLPPNAYYIADFISEEEEGAILQKVPISAALAVSFARLIV